MRRLASALAGVVALAVLAAPVSGQEAPRSILPEGMFGPPPAPVEPDPVPTDETEPGAPAAPPGVPAADAPVPTTAPVVPAPQPSPLDLAAPPIDMARTGLLTPAAGGMGPRAFAGSDARFLGRLMRRLDAPIASRWAHITLRRALVSITPAPAGARPADWVAARAHLVMRMGEADVAQAMVGRVPTDAYTPMLYAAAADAALAAGDLPALCPLSLTGQTLSEAPVWRLASAMCAAFEGDDITASNLFDRLRAEERVAPFDIALAERAASGVGGARSANIEWDEVGELNLYRIGMAGAGGSPLPDRFLRDLPPPVMGWRFRGANVPDTERIAAALTAGAQGVAGAADLVGFHAALAASPDGAGVGDDTATRLRQAFAGSAADRVDALVELWDADDATQRYGAMVMTGGAAAAIAPAARFARHAPDIMAAALAGGRADAALAWWPIAEAAGGAGAQRAWALAAVADPAERVEVDSGRFGDWLEAERARDPLRATHRARLLLATLTALGRTSGLGWGGIRDDLGLAPLANRWTARLAGAAAAGRPGEVALIAAIGLQARWADIPAAHLAAIVAAYVEVGLAKEARLIAAEAMTRA